MHPSRPVVYSIGQQDGCLVCFYRALSLHLVDACPLQLHITLNQLSIATFEALPFLLLRASSFLSPCHLLHAPNHVSPRSFRTSPAGRCLPAPNVAGYWKGCSTRVGKTQPFSDGRAHGDHRTLSRGWIGGIKGAKAATVRPHQRHAPPASRRSRRCDFTAAARAPRLSRGGRRQPRKDVPAGRGAAASGVPWLQSGGSAPA